MRFGTAGSVTLSGSGSTFRQEPAALPDPAGNLYYGDVFASDPSPPGSMVSFDIEGSLEFPAQRAVLRYPTFAKLTSPAWSLDTVGAGGTSPVLDRSVGLKLRWRNEGRVASRAGTASVATFLQGQRTVECSFPAGNEAGTIPASALGWLSPGPAQVSLETRSVRLRAERPNVTEVSIRLGVAADLPGSPQAVGPIVLD